MSVDNFLRFPLSVNLALESGVVGGELLGQILQPSIAPLAGLAAILLHGDVLIWPRCRLTVH